MTRNLRTISFVIRSPERKSDRMESGISKARRKLESVAASVGGTGGYSRTGSSGGVPDFHKDFHILNARIADLLKSHEDAGFEKPEDEPPGAEGTTLPIISVDKVKADIEKWTGRNVINDGELEFTDRGSDGCFWHAFRDGTGLITAFSQRGPEHGKGTLFGVAHRTTAGKQVFLEIKNFHPFLSDEESDPL